VVIVLGDTVAKLFDLNLEAGVIKKKAEYVIEQQGSIIRREFFVNFLRFDSFCLVRLWEEEIEGEQENQVEYEIQGKKLILNFLQKGKRIEKNIENKIDCLDGEYHSSIDDLKVFMINSWKGKEEVLNIFYPNVSVKDYEVFESVGNKIKSTHVKLGDGKTIE
jgi:hypothetical protein